MRKLIVLASAAVMTLSLAVPGLAKPDKTPPGQEPPPGATCSDRVFEDPALWQATSASDDFSVTLTAEQPAACVDVTSVAGDWAIHIDALEAAGLEVQIKDSVPGDFCFREGYGGRKHPIPQDIAVWDVPAAAVDACTPGEVGLAADQDPALVFMVSFAPDRRPELPPSVRLDVALP